MNIDPLQQFEIQVWGSMPFGAWELAFSNSALSMLISAVVVLLFLTLSMRGRALVPTRWQSLAELTYEFIAGMVRENVGKEGREFFPFIFTLFVFVLFGNLLGLIPIFYTFTSSILVTFSLAAVVFIGVTVVGFMRHGLGYFRLLFPHGAPLAVAPVLIPVELISYLARPISLSVRLFANMTVGHVIFKVLAGFTIALGVFGIAPLAFLVGITILELGIAILQAYIFTVLSCIYLHDAIHLH